MLLYHLGDGNEALPLRVHFPLCNPNARFCSLRRNQPILVHIDFAPRWHTPVLGAAVHAWDGFRWNQWDLGFHDRACDYLTNNRRCPIQAHQRVTYELRTAVPRNVRTGVEQTLLFRVFDQTRYPVACFQIRARFTEW